MNPAMTPSLGRIVVLTCDNAIAAKLNQLAGRRYNIGEPCAGIVTRALENGACNITLFPDAEEVLHIATVPFSSGSQPGTWSWPERVEAVAKAA